MLSEVSYGKNLRQPFSLPSSGILTMIQHFSYNIAKWRRLLPPLSCSSSQHTQLPIINAANVQSPPKLPFSCFFLRNRQNMERIKFIDIPLPSSKNCHMDTTFACRYFGRLSCHLLFQACKYFLSINVNFLKWHALFIKKGAHRYPHLS